jgi:hypothetical protein
VAIAQIGSATTASNAGTALAVPVPTGAGAGSLMVVWYLDIGTNTNTPTVPSGWTSGILNNIGNSSLGVAWGTPSGSTETFTPNDGATSAIAIAVAYSGVASGTWDPSTPASNYGSTGSTTTPTITGLENSNTEATTVNGDLIMWMTCAFGTSSSIVLSGWPYAGVQSSVSGSGSGLFFTLGLCTTTQATAGAITTAKSITASNTIEWFVQQIALKATPTTTRPNSPRIVTATAVTTAAVW